MISTQTKQQQTNQSRGRILIADDEQTFVDALADVLRREGYECQTVNDGFAAAAELNTGQQYDVLIADIRMPGNPELELVKHVPSIAEGLPVILVTAHPSAESAVRSTELPVISYLVKPIDMRELLPLLRRGIEYSAVFRAAKNVNARLNNWLAETDAARDVLTTNAADNSITPGTFANITIRNLVGCLDELQTLWRKTSQDTAADVEAGAAIAECLDAAMLAFEHSARAQRS